MGVTAGNDSQAACSCRAEPVCGAMLGAAGGELDGRPGPSGPGAILVSGGRVSGQPRQCAAVCACVCADM